MKQLGLLLCLVASVLLTPSASACPWISGGESFEAIVPASTDIVHLCLVIRNSASSGTLTYTISRGNYGIPDSSPPSACNVVTRWRMPITLCSDNRILGAGEADEFNLLGVAGGNPHRITISGITGAPPVMTLLGAYPDGSEIVIPFTRLRCP